MTIGTQISDMTPVAFDDLPDDAQLPWVTTTGAEGYSLLRNYRSPVAAAIRARVLASELADDTGAALVGADDADSGSLFTTVQGFITRLMSSVGSALVGFLPLGSGADARTVQDKLRENVSVKDFGAVGDDATNDSAAFAAAMAASSSVYVPRGEYRVSELTIPNGVTLYGDGTESILRLATGGFRVFSTTGTSRWTIRDMAWDANDVGVSIALFTTCQLGKIQNISARGSTSHGIELDNCGACVIDHVDLYETGGASSSAALYLKDPTGTGSFNSISTVSFRDINGRGIFNLGNNHTRISGLQGDMTNGEILLFQSSVACVATGIIMTGAEPGAAALSDGIAINGGCLYITISDFHVANNSGHGVSINGQFEADGVTPMTGAAYCTISSGTIVAPDEGGVIITDQSVPGSVPAGNLVSDVVVQNAGKQVSSEAFGASGATDSQFINCTAVDSQGVPTTSYGFKEGNGMNTAARNSFRGRLIGSFTTAATLLVAATSSAQDTVIPKGTATYDPASLADGDGATTTVTVTGAVLGDTVVVSFSLDLQGVLLTAWVSAANTVSVRFQNETGGVIDLGSGTITAKVLGR